MVNNQFALSFTNKTELYKHYMPFIQNGGLFVRTVEQFSLGDSVTLSLQWPDEKDKEDMIGRVVWITPQSAQRGLPAGIGVQFPQDKATLLCGKIEGYLGDMLHSNQATDTL